MITIDVDDAEVRAALAALRGRIADMRPALRSAGAVLRDVSMDSFDRQRAPSGERWLPLSMTTLIARARRRGGANAAKRAAIVSTAKALLDTGRLRNSIRQYELTPQSVTIGTNVRYSAIHQFGGNAGRGRRVRIPARPFLGLSADGKAELLTIFERHILGAAQ